MSMLSNRALKGLSQYAYKSGGLTWLDHLHMPAWNALVDRLPMWLAPNLITLTGTLGVVLAWLVSVLLQPTYQEDVPGWVTFLYGLAVVVYVNLDCLDGKQARRTGSSSPLGQLFDHGCDAVSLHLLLDTARASMHIGAQGAIIMEMAVCLPWMLAHYEEYHTGLMLYGNGYWGVVEGNYAIAVIHFVTAVFGPGLWARPLPFQVPPALQPLNSIAGVALAGVALMAVVTGAGQLYRVLVFSPASLSPKEAGHKQLGNGAGFLHLTYIALLLSLGYVYLLSSATVAAASAAVAASDASNGGSTAQGAAGWRSPLWLAGSAGGATGTALTWLQSAAEVYHLRLVGATYGLVYALVATQFILAHMCKEPFTPAVWSLAVLAVGCANTQLQVVPAVLLDALLGLVATIGYTYYVASIVNQICKYLGINCLTIKPKPKPKRVA